MEEKNMNEKQIIQEIIDLDKSEIEKFIEERTNKLDETATEDREELSLMTIGFSRMKGIRENTEVVGYIPKRVHLKKMQFDMASFVLDDKSVYKIIIDYIKNADPNNVKRGDSVNNNYIMKMVQSTIIKYFGLRGNEKSRNYLYDSKSDIDDDMLSISDFKNNNAAMCVERSAMAQNILSFLGYNPMMIYGYLSSKRAAMNEGHAFNCIIREGKGMLMDFTNPINKDGRYFKPAQYPINDESLQKFMKGKAQIEVQHKDLYTENGKVKEDVIPLVYSSEEIDPKYFEHKREKETIKPNNITSATKDMTLQEINSVTQEIMQLEKHKADKENNLTK